MHLEPQARAAAIHYLRGYRQQHMTTLTILDKTLQPKCIEVLPSDVVDALSQFQRATRIALNTTDKQLAEVFENRI